MSDAPAAQPPVAKETDSGPPKWLTADFLETQLKNEFKVNSLKIENAVAVGENYATLVYRASANTTLGPIPFIVKCVPENEFRKKMIEDSGFMIREIRMYTKTLPLLGGTSLSPNYPYCNYSQEGPENQTVILRDMSPFGYRTSPRHDGLDFNHCRLAITELAHLHGLSAALRIQKPEVFKKEIQDSYVELMYSEENREKTTQFMKSLVPTISEAVRNNFPFRFRSISNLIDGMVDTAFDDLRDAVNEVHLPKNKDKIEDRVIVLNHGDFWSNNMLFKYSNGSDKPEACMMIDFQVARCASPALDLHYFFYSSTTQATRRAHMNELLQLYLNEANAALRLKGIHDAGKKFYKSVAEIKKDMIRHSDFGFLFSCVVMPLVIADQSAAPNLDDMTDDNFMIGDENPFAKMYSGPRFIKRFTELLEDFDDFGYFKQRAEKSTTEL